ncbi:MAG TPA: hypothetical protein ENN33_08020 [Ignavibacteria bacterium]|nr:hypothetical protein [Ignavibacteria bacterium]
MSVKNIEYLRSVFKNGLCTRCGTCVGLSSGAIRFIDIEENYRPEQVGDLTDELANRIWTGCSAKKIPMALLNEYSFGQTESNNEYIGYYKKLGIAYAEDSEIRRNSASGGLLSTILLWLLETEEVQGIVTTRMSNTSPWKPETFIATKKEEVKKAAQSKYLITSVNQVLPQIQEFEGCLAYVGLPCQVHSIRKLQIANDPSVKNIKYIFGPFCGNTLHFTSIKMLLRSYGYKEHTGIEYLAFREGEWPGKMVINMNDGKKIELPKFHANYLIPFSMMKRCLLCTDFTNELTDISGGDAWAPEYEERGKGFSLAIVRSKSGNRLFENLVREGKIHFNPIGPDEAIKMHSHGYDFKKRGAYIRIGFRRLLKLDTPDDGRASHSFHFTRYFVEIIITALFYISGFKISRLLMSKISPKYMGWLFIHTRSIWKYFTKGIKRRGLNAST